MVVCVETEVLVAVEVGVVVGLVVSVVLKLVLSVGHTYGLFVPMLLSATFSTAAMSSQESLLVSTLRTNPVWVQSNLENESWRSPRKVFIPPMMLRHIFLLPALNPTKLTSTFLHEKVSLDPIAQAAIS